MLLSAPSRDPEICALAKGTMRHFPVKLKSSFGSFGLLTRNPPEATVIFVHGFGGTPRGTWVDFEHLIDELDAKFPAWGDCDLLFYGYHSYK